MSNVTVTGTAPGTLLGYAEYTSTNITNSAEGTPTDIPSLSLSLTVAGSPVLVFFKARTAFSGTAGGGYGVRLIQGASTTIDETGGISGAINSGGELTALAKIDAGSGAVTVKAVFTRINGTGTATLVTSVAGGAAKLWAVSA